MFLRILTGNDLVLEGDGPVVVRAGERAQGGGSLNGAVAVGMAVAVSGSDHCDGFEYGIWKERTKGRRLDASLCRGVEHSTGR